MIDARNRHLRRGVTVDDYQGTLFERRQLVHTGIGWTVVIYHVRARRRDGVPIWWSVGEEPRTHWNIRQLLRQRPDVRVGGIHGRPVFGPGAGEPVERIRRDTRTPQFLSRPTRRRTPRLTLEERMDRWFRLAESEAS
jgi:hypothetical protein